MNLPIVTDIAIGLILIYLTLSLLASEVQELLSTLLQWRAKHLKQAIETLLAGESNTQSDTDTNAVSVQAVQQQMMQAKALANSLYGHPFLQSLNQEAKGLIGLLGQWISQITRTQKFFSGKSSGPSYLPSTIFASTLLETLRASDLIQKLSELKLNQLINQKLLEPIRDIVIDFRNSQANDDLLERELQGLETDLNTIIQRFIQRDITLTNSFNQVASSVNRFAASVAAVLPDDDSLSQIFLKRLASIQQEVPTLLKDHGPTIAEVISELNNMSWVAQYLQQNEDYRVLVSRFQDTTVRKQFQDGYALLQAMNDLVRKSSQGREDYQGILMKVSPYLRDSLAMLARRAQTKADGIEQGAYHLQRELSGWFDRSMDRASGVYKRNAKGVAMTIGFLLAVSTNTDTLHLINRFAKDPTLRSAYGQAASQLVSSNPAAVTCLESAQDQSVRVKCLQSGDVQATAANLRQALEGTNQLPIGWNLNNWQDQWRSQQPVASGFKIFLGWLLSAIAISMGAPFWFNLLNQVINIRNTGKPPAPAPAPTDQSSNQQ